MPYHHDGRVLLQYMAVGVLVISKVVEVRSNPKTQATVVRLRMTNEQMMPTLPTTLEAAACKMEGSTNAAQTWVKQIKADLKKQWLSLPDAKREALKRQAWKTIVQIMIQRHQHLHIVPHQ